MVFDELASKFSPTIKRIAYKLNGHYRSFSHDDLFQEAMFHLWTNFGAGRLKDKTDSYILQGCYFHLKNYIRKENERANVFSIDACLEDDAGFLTQEAFIFKPCAEKEFRDLLDDRLRAERIEDAGFSAREKMVLHLIKEGATTRDIGKRIGISHVMVVKVISSLRKKCVKFID